MLHIDSIELNGFLGMWLNNIKVFKLEDIKRFQLVLGRNGCGKSRLIRVMSLICPNKTDFHVGGFKRMQITHNDTIYELYCERTKGNMKCSLKNLSANTFVHENVTAAVFNTSIKELFNYDKDIHDLITGKALFTKMKGPERKKWFSILSESDLSFALQFYKKSREHHRDFTGAIKSLKHSIGLLEPKVTEDSAELLAISNRIEALQGQIKTLDRRIENCGADWTVTEDSLLANEAKVDAINVEVLKTPIHIDGDLKGLDEHQINGELIRIQTKYDMHMEELDGLVKRVEHANKMQNIDVDKIYSLLDELTGKIELHTKSVTTFRDLLELEEGCLESAIQMSNYYTPKLLNLFHEFKALPDTSDVNALTGKYNDRVISTERKINLNRNSIAMGLDRIKNIDHICDIECPKCDNKFKPGVDDNERALILHDIEGLERNNVTLQEHYQECKANHALYASAANALNSAVEAMVACSDNDATVLLFSQLNDRGITSKYAPDAEGLVNHFMAELVDAKAVVGLRARKERVDLDLEVIKANKSEDYTTLNRKVTELESTLEDLTRQRQFWDDRSRRLVVGTRHVNRVKQLGELHEQLLHERDSIVEVLIRNTEVSILSDERKDLWDLLIVAKQRFGDMEAERVRLVNMKADLATNITRQANAAKVVSAMSPDGGILAQYLFQSITKITDLMTLYINSIWGYEMVVMPCDVTTGELDYMFPFYANSAEQVTEDVSLGSKAQQEVINFVFMLSVYKAVGLEGYPLFLDELGSGFDEGHKPTMIDFIKSLIERGHHSQVVMVSHDPETHFQLSHADVCVIDTAGITLPAVYNKNVTIGY